LLDESCPLEESPEKRHDPYAYGKLKQEEIVRHLSRIHNIPFVILRPGTVFGPGKRELTGRIGFNLRGLFLHVGGSNQLPLTYVDNCADAIVLAGIRPNIANETFNVVDDDLLTSREFLRAYHQRRRHAVCLPLPYGAAYLLCALCEGCSKCFRQMPRSFNRRRCAAEWKGNRFSNEKLRRQLGWKPIVPMKQALANFLSQF
jgi:nucleoside-diphosphate-sugar epimerase